MNKNFAALLGAAAVVATVGGAQAATPTTPNSSQALSASSYADLLAPVPDAVAHLVADDTARAQAAARPDVKLAENHHHHHNTVVIRRPRDHHHRDHHHHHHHSSGVFIGIPGVAGVTVGSGNESHHHHYYNHND